MDRITFYEMISKAIYLQTLLFDSKPFFGKNANVKMHKIKSNFSRKWHKVKSKYRVCLTFFLSIEVFVKGEGIVSTKIILKFEPKL